MNKYLKLKINYLKVDSNLEFDIYVYLPSKDKYLKYLAKGTNLPKSKIDAFKSLSYNKVKQLYISEQAVQELKNNNQLVDLSQIIESEFEQAIKEEKKFDNIIENQNTNHKNLSNIELVEETETLNFDNNIKILEENLNEEIITKNKHSDETVKNYLNENNLDDEPEELDVYEEKEIENIINDKTTSDEEKSIVIERIISTKNPGTIKKFSNIIKSNVEFYKFDQLDEFLKKIENKEKFTEEEIKKAMKKVNDIKITDLNLIDNFFSRITSTFNNLNDQKIEDVEKNLFDFSEFALNSLQIHDSEDETVSLSRNINEICSLLSDKLKNCDPLLYHSVLVSILSTSIGVLLETNDTKLLKDLCISGLLHDIGFIKLGMDNFDIFIKNENPTKGQLEVFKEHPIEAYNIVSKLPKVSILSDIVIKVILEHHEHPHGYPNKKSIITKTMQVKIVSISDHISYKIQNNVFTDFKSELKNLLNYQSKLEYKMFDAKLIKQIIQKL